ncbi:hypothetical protein ACFL6E_07010 [Candidatus Neomarinimicrobiota bacterium]
MNPNSTAIRRRIGAGLVMLGMIGYLSRLAAADGQFQYTIYYDSNPLEATDEVTPAVGHSIRGLTRQKHVYGQLTGEFTLLGQAFIEPMLPYETKGIVSPNLRLKYNISPTFSVNWNFTAFSKAYTKQSGAYRRCESEPYLVFLPYRPLQILLSARNSKKTLHIPARLHFVETDFTMRASYSYREHYLLELSFAERTIQHKDLLAYDVCTTDCDSLEAIGPRSDHGILTTLHLRYRGKFITGLSLGSTKMRSNSLGRHYKSWIVNCYASASLSERSFIHLSLRRIDKQYRSTGISDIDYYVDPEEPLQNLVHIRYEHKYGKQHIAYLQLSMLQNETTVSRIYYNKTLIEIGTKYNF